MPMTKNLYKLRCPTRQAFERAARGFNFNVMPEGDNVLIRRGAVVGRFVGGGQSNHSSLSLNAMSHASDTEMEAAVTDFSKAFPTIAGARA